MGFFDRISEFFSAFDWHHNTSFTEPTQINPATGLPMTGPGIGGVDVGGNPYGTDLHRWQDDHHHHQSSGSNFSDWDHRSHSASSYDPTYGY